MRQNSVSRWVVGLLATMMLAACSSGTGSDVGSVNVSLTVEGADINKIKYSISGPALSAPLEGNLPVDENDQVNQVIANLPVGSGYIMELQALNGEVVLCSGTSAPFAIAEGQTTQVDITLICDEDTRPDTPYGNAQVNADFEVNPVVINGCPVVHSYAAIPANIPENGDSAAEVVASDPNDDPLTYSWSASEGSFDDSSSASPVYTCSVPGTQTLTAVVSDGEAACDATVQITVACGGDVFCPGVVCDPTGNECTQNTCVEAQKACVESPVADGSACAGGDGQCVDGACVIDLCPASCDDGNECTVDSCDPAVGVCEYTDLDNAQVCNGGSGICVTGTCQDVGVNCAQLNCDDGDPCTLDVCVEGSTATDDATCAPKQAVLDGTACGANATCQSGVCVGNAPNAQTVAANVDCPLPLGLGNANVDINLDITPLASWTPNGTVTVGFSASAVLPASLGDLMIGLGTDQINIDSLVADLAVAGGTPSPISVTDAGLTLDVDANDDGFAEDVTIVIAVPDTAVTNNGAASVDFAVSFFEVALSGVPLLGNMVVTSDPVDSSQIGCTLSSTTASFPVN